VGQPLEVRILS